MNRVAVARYLPLAALMLILVGSAQAEVRLVPAKGKKPVAHVDVTVTPRGPWTAARPRNGVLNPSGDLLGDGFPGTAADGRGVAVAWLSPANQTVRLALSDNARWTSESVAVAQQGVGTPRVGLLSDALAVVWQASSGLRDGHMAAIAWSRMGGAGESVALGDGFVIGLTVADDAVWVLAVDPSVAASLRAIRLRPADRNGTGVFVTSFLEHPIPLPDARSPIVWAGVGGASQGALTAPLTAPAAVVVSGGGGRAVARPPVGPLTPDPTLVVPMPEIQSVDRRGVAVVVVTSWASARTLAFVEVDEWGVVGGVEELTAPDDAEDFSDDLVKQALKVIATR